MEAITQTNMTIEERYGRLDEKVDGIKADVLEIKETLKHLGEQFAPKYVEKAIWFVGGLVGSGIMWILVNAISAHFGK